MWDKISGTIIKYRDSIKDALTGTIVEYSIKHTIDKTLDNIIEFFSTITQEELYKMALDNKMIGQDKINEYMEKVGEIIKMAKENNILNNETILTAKNIILNFSTEDAIKILLSKSYRESELGNSRPLVCMALIVNSPTCIRWINDNLENIKRMVISELERS